MTGRDPDWPRPAELGRLPAAHRRAAAAALASAIRTLETLDAEGLVRVPGAAFQRLRELAAGAGGSPPRSAVAAIAALRSLADGLEPAAMARYGPPGPEAAAVLGRLAAALRALLDAVEAEEEPPAFRALVRPIGTVRPGGGDGGTAEIEVAPRFHPALAGLERHRWIWVVAWLHEAGPWRAVVVPRHGGAPAGVLATRAPARPNPIGLSAVRLLAIEGGVLRVAGLDLRPGTPVLDLKPYVPERDARPDGGRPPGVG